MGLKAPIRNQHVHWSQLEVHTSLESLHISHLRMSATVIGVHFECGHFEFCRLTIGECVIESAATHVAGSAANGTSLDKTLRLLV